MTEPHPSEVREPARDLPVLGRWDVVVCGGGPAGCAAAVAAGRAGAKTLLVEATGALGGAPVTQNVFPILSTNGVDFQGIWHDWARELRALDGMSPIAWEPRFNTHWLVGGVHPEAVKLAWDRLVAAAGADLLHLAPAAAARVAEGAVEGVYLETRAGRVAVLADRVIDATGDGLLCATAGCASDCGADGQPWAMGVGMVPICGGLPMADDYAFGRSNTLAGTGRSAGNDPLFMAGLIRLLKVHPLNPWDLTRALREGRDRCRERFEHLRRQHGPGVFLTGTSAQPGVRSSRRIRGRAVATDADAWDLVRHADGVARSSWEIDIHSPEDPRRKGVAFEDPAYRRRQQRTEAGEWFDVPYGCLVPEGVENLLVAGRCISAEHVAQSSLRIQQTCMALGEAAGLAAARSLSAGVPPSRLDGETFAAELAAMRQSVEPAFDVPPHPG